MKLFGHSMPKKRKDETEAAYKLRVKVYFNKLREESSKESP